MYGIYTNLSCRIAFRTRKLHYERISGNFSDFIDFRHQVRIYKTRSFLNISCISKCMGFTIIWVAHLNSDRKNYPMKEFQAIFSISSILAIRLAYAKQGNFSILAVFFKMYGIYLNLGCRFEFTTQKLPYERISGNFSDFIDFGHQVPVCETRSFLNISCISKCMGFT